MMMQAVSLAVLMSIFSLPLILGSNFPGREWLRLFGFGFVSFSLWWMLWTLLEVRHKAAPYGARDDTPEKVTDREDTPL